MNQLRKGNIYRFPNKKERKFLKDDDQDRRVHIVCTFRRIFGILFVVFFAVFCIKNYKVLTVDNLSNVASYMSFSLNSDAQDLSVIPFESSSYSNIAAFGAGLAISYMDNISLLNPGGYVYMQQQSGFSNTVFKTSDDILYAYDANSGTRISGYSVVGKIFEIRTEAEIISLSCSNAGVGVVTDDTGYKSGVRIYDNNQKELFKFLTSKYYILNTDLADNLSTFAVNVFYYENQQVIGKVMIFDMKKEQPICEFSLGECIPLDVKYLDNNTLFIISDNAFYIINTLGKIIYTQNFNASDALRYNISGDKIIIATRDFNKSFQTNITLCDKKGSAKSFSIEDGIRDLKLSSSLIGILTQSDGIVCDLNFNELFRDNRLSDAKSLILRDDGRVYAIYPNRCETVNVFVK